MSFVWENYGPAGHAYVRERIVVVASVRPSNGKWKAWILRPDQDEDECVGEATTVDAAKRMVEEKIKSQ